MATKKAEQTSEVQAFVLRDCGFGEAGQVVTLSPSDAETGAQHGMLDLHPDAIKAAKTKE
jgi:hypothetical protein